ILEKQRANKKAIKDALSQPDLKSAKISFRKIPDEKGDSATFLSFLMPDESRARKVAMNFGKAGVDSCFFWYDNNWHYMRNWNHLKKLKSSAMLPVKLLDYCPDYANVNLPQSDGIMGRTISMLIKLSWREEDLTQRIEKMIDVLKIN
ncbi:MAG: L-glutamine--2-deoxy-scyllo-inosose aminotransferase KanB, partial [Proteobacteria bacterium]|nr:L-glutamine--2-deoxy-scyllo-inosose aminotransferase KanB [Pseudomonadota bacterium]